MRDLVQLTVRKMVPGSDESCRVKDPTRSSKTPVFQGFFFDHKGNIG